MFLWLKLYVVAPLTQRWHTRKVPELPKVGQAVPGAVALVTGPTSGLGKITAIDLGRRGAKGTLPAACWQRSVRTSSTQFQFLVAAVILACRDTQRGLQVAKEVEAAQVSAGFSVQTQVVKLDQSSLESVEECANEVLATNKELHILINNGGIYDIGGVLSLALNN
jgi:NAD(P)-dependent dehydrogenase (short-subunit alcohol dehydrogenase family)